MPTTKAYFTEGVGVRLAPDTMDWLTRRADAERSTLSAYVRRLVEAAAKQDLQGKNQD